MLFSSMEYDRRMGSTLSSTQPHKMNSIEKALAIMRVLSSPDGPHRLADIAQHAQLNRPSTHRILQTLIENNYAVAAGDGSYTVGFAMRALAAASSDDLVAHAAPILNELQRTTGHTVHFAAFAGASAVYVAKVEGTKPYQMASRVGMQIELHRTSIGKSILAALPTDEADRLLLTVSSAPSVGVDDLGVFHQDFETIRDRGFAIDDEENEPNVRCVGAVVRDTNGHPIGGVSLSGLAFVLDVPRLLELGKSVVRAADSISAFAGYGARGGEQR